MSMILRILTLVIFSSCISSLLAQNVVLEDNFDGNEFSWTENGKPDLGENIIMEGEFKFDSKASSQFFSQDSKIPTLLLSEGVLPIDPAQGFSISVDMAFDHIRFFGPNLYLLNLTSGFLLEYDDEYNFIAVAVNEKNCYILFYKEGKLIRYKQAAVKMKNVNKNKINANLKIEYIDYKLKIYVDDIEMTEMRKVTIESPVIALFVTGKRKVAFDNVKIAQY